VLYGTAGSVTAYVKINVGVETNLSPFYFVTPLSTQVWVPFGGSGQIQFQLQAGGPADYSIQLSLSGLPTGASATIDPPVVTTGTSMTATTTITITAATNAPETQNTYVTLTGTPSAPVAPASISFSLDVTPNSTAISNNRTDYVSTEGTPYAAVYDPAHKLIFATNESWNRVDVISSTSHGIISRILLPDPRGVDISQDDSTVWVSTGSRQVFAINTSSLAVTRYALPLGTLSYWEGGQLLALADGTLMNIWSAGRSTGIVGVAIWDPTSNVLTSLSTPTYDAVQDFGIYRSGDGKRVYFISGVSDGAAFYYDVLAKTFSTPVTLGGYAIGAAVNVDGSRVVVCDANGPYMYDGGFTVIGPVPGCQSGFGGETPWLAGGSVFSADNLYLYQVYESDAGIPLTAKVDANTLKILSLAPAMATVGVMTEMDYPNLTTPFAVDQTGVIMGLQNWGIAFDDATYAQNYLPAAPPDWATTISMDPYFGPLNGGTTSSGLGYAFAPPGVWYGALRGTAELSSTGALSITSPPTTTPGPVNIKMLFPDGVEAFNPLYFSYGPYLQYPLISGASPEGDVPGQIVGYGMPGDNVSGTLMIGGSAATLASPGSGGLPYAATVGSPYPNKILSYTVPHGSPGWADITLTTPDGTSTLPKSFLYARSVNDYASPDTFTAVLYDSQRQQLYLSAGNHIDVFSLSSNQFTTPLNPPATGSSKQFGGLALTPDGSLLLAADVLDGSLAVVSPDNPSNSFVVPIVPVMIEGAGCNVGPLYVAAAANNQALVVTGALPSAQCGPGGDLYLANLATRTVAPPTCGISPGFVVGDKDGQKIGIGSSQSLGGHFSIYDPVGQSCADTGVWSTFGAAFSGDGQIAASNSFFTDASANLLGWIATPNIYYAALNNAIPPINPRVEPQLNDAGSLYYMAYPNSIDIIDVHHGILRLRFSLSETVANTAVPMSIDSGGRFIYVITSKGLTIVDLGEALLSIGWLNVASASAGTQVTIRGSGFNSSTTATLGGQSAVVAVSDENTLTVTVPSLNPGPASIALKNGDGQTYTAVGLLTIQ
jgi:hypothetical protein